MATEEVWRCFVAVPIGEELRASLGEYVAELRKAPWADAWRWTDPASWHVTLAFLGDISPSSVPEIAKALQEVAARHTAFSVPTGGLGAFPSARRPRVLWYGVEDPSGQLAALAADVRVALHVDEAPFRGHITLARPRSSSTIRSVGSVPRALQSSVAVDQLTLFRSFGSSARHEPVHAARLSSRGRAAPSGTNPSGRTA